jgi:hypothetical protein
MISRIAGYRSAASNLGVASCLRLHLQKRFGRKPVFNLNSKFLDHHVSVRRGSSDMLAFYQILVSREYSGVDNINANFVIDLGANVGYASLLFSITIPALRAALFTVCASSRPASSPSLGGAH